MYEKVYNFENPFNDVQNDVFKIKFSDIRIQNDSQTQDSQIDQNMIHLNLNKDLIRFDEASQIQVENISKQSSQIKFCEQKKDQQEKNRQKIDDKDQKTLRLQKPLISLLPNHKSIEQSSLVSLSFEQKRHKPSILVPSAKNQTFLTSRILNRKFMEKQNKGLRQKKPLTQKHVRIASQKFIKYFSEEDIQQNQQFQERNPQSFQDGQNLFAQLCKQFQYTGDFSLIRKQIVELTLERKLNVMQNTNEFVTVKNASNKDYCQCLIKACLNMEQTGGVYQLKNCIYKRNKAKFILVSGSQKQYVLFFKKLLIRLWKINKLKLKSDCIVEFLVKMEKQSQQMIKMKKEYTKLYNQMNGISGYEQKIGVLASKFVPKSLVISIKDNFKRLRSPQKYQSSIKQSSKSSEQRLIELNSKVNKKYYELLNKLQQNSTGLSLQNLQEKLQKQVYFHQFPIWKLWGFHNRTLYEQFTKRRQIILSKKSLKQIFDYLQLEEQYSLFLLSSSVKSRQKNEDIENSSQKGKKMKSCYVIARNEPEMSVKQNRQKSESLSPEQMPYKQCIGCIENMANGIMMPQKFLLLLNQFIENLKKYYSQLYANRPLIKLSSMDEQLPVTIFVLLIAQIGKDKTAALNLIGKLEWMGRWLEQKERQNSNQDQYGQRETSQQLAKARKMIVTIQAAFLFITQEWKITDQQNQIE